MHYFGYVLSCVFSSDMYNHLVFSKVCYYYIAESYSMRVKPYRPPPDIESRLESIARSCLPSFGTIDEPYKLQDRRSKVQVQFPSSFFVF